MGGVWHSKCSSAAPLRHGITCFCVVDCSLEPLIDFAHARVVMRPHRLAETMPAGYAWAEILRYEPCVALQYAIIIIFPRGIE